MKKPSPPRLSNNNKYNIKTSLKENYKKKTIKLKIIYTSLNESQQINK